MSLLDNFLGTFTSRYSQFDGYWLFGFLVNECGEIAVDLLSESPADAGNSPLERTAQIARVKFAEQLEKLQIHPHYLSAATLTIRLPGENVSGEVNGQNCLGFEVTFSAQAVSDRGASYRSERKLFVAPHHPSNERRSARGID